jgi:RNA polymerase sigma factor (sigma-70 family)
MNKVKALVLKATDSTAALAEKHDAFGKLVQSFQDMAFACAYAVLGDFQLAEDAAQEAFICAWQRLDQLRQPEAFPGWLRRIVLTECNRLTRRKSLPLTSLADDMNVPSLVASPQSEIERAELENAVFAAIKMLPENDRLVVVLFYLKEQSQLEISAFLEVPVTTVAKRLYSARARLAGLMTEEFKRDLLAHRPSRDRSFAEKVGAGIFDEYVGEYRFERRPDITVRISKEGNRLIGEAAGQRNELSAENRSDSELETKEFDGRGKFVRNHQGRITHFIYFEFGQEMGIARKVS